MYAGWTETDEHAAARMARRNAEHERIMAEKEAAQLSTISPEYSVMVTREG